MSANTDRMDLVLSNASKSKALVEQYEKGTVTLADGVTEITLTPGQINELKAAFVALRIEGRQAWADVSA